MLYAFSIRLRYPSSKDRCIPRILRQSCRAGGSQETCNIQWHAIHVNLRWTILWVGMKTSWIMNLKGKSIVLYHDGERQFSTTTFPTTDKAVVVSLKYTEETKNRITYIQDATTTLKKMVDKWKTANGGAEGWTETVVSTEKLLDQAWKKLKLRSQIRRVLLWNLSMHQSERGIWKSVLEDR